LGTFSKFFGLKEEIKPDEAVLVYVKLSDNEFGTGEERMWCYSLEDRLIEEILKQQSGELDGHDFGQGYCIFYLYGKCTEILYNSIIGVLGELKLPPQSYTIKRYGGPGAKEIRLEFN